MILGDIFERNARCFGRHPAIHFEGETLTHSQLARRITLLVNALVARGTARQARIAVLSRNNPEFVEVLGAAGLGGYIAMGLNYRLAEPEQVGILQDADPAVLFYEAHFADRITALRPHLSDQVTYVQIRGDGSVPDWALDYETLLIEGKDGPPMQRADPDDTFLLIYTSGTTGKPKGALLGNEAQLEQARVQALAHSATPIDRMLIVMPFYHIGGPTEMLTYLCVGASIVLHREFDAQKVLQSIEEKRVTSAHLAPTMIQMMLEELERDSFDLSSLHTVCYASAPMSVALSKRARARFGPIFMQIYGMTENGLGSVLLKHQHVLEGEPAETRRLASAGQPYLGTEMRILREDGSQCDVDEPGELWLRSASLMQGYWRNEAATQAALVDGWLRTGDIGFFDHEGFLFIVDRKKDMIVSGGENIYSREVEEALLQHPAVLEAAVVGVPDAKWGESVIAFVALRDGGSVSEEELIEHCRSLIASYKKPRYVRFMDRLTRSPALTK